MEGCLFEQGLVDLVLEYICSKRDLLLLLLLELILSLDCGLKAQALGNQCGLSVP